MQRAVQQRWRAGRYAYRIFLAGWFALIAFRVGPDWFNYHRLTHPDPSDYVGLVNDSCAPVLRAMVAYQHDTGRNVGSIEELVPKYLPPRRGEVVWFGRQDGAVTFPFFQRRLRVKYTPVNAPQVWTIEGPALDGVIPAPPVPGYPPPDTDNAR